MRNAVVTTNWEYKSEGGIIVNLEEHLMFKGMFTNAIREGSDGIIAWCFITEKRLSFEASEKLKRQIQQDSYENFEYLTEDEFNRQDDEMLTIGELFTNAD